MSILNSFIMSSLLCFLPADAPSAPQVRSTIQKSIPFIEEQGVWWIEKKKCVSCHRVGNMVWSLTLAKRNGFQVSDRLNEWRQWSIDQSLSENDEGRIVGLGNKEGVAQLLLTFAQEDSPAGETANPDADDVRMKLFAMLREGQTEDGTWKPGGQLPSQKRPKAETTGVSTMWLTLALADDADNTESKLAVTTASEHVAQSSPGGSTEWFVVRLLLAIRSGNKEARDHFSSALSEQQNADGGWGWIAGEDSDALGTGMALYALAAAGGDHSRSGITRARQFLVTTQREDGSWPVRGTKKNRKDKIQDTAVYWGTTWAAMGLINSLED